MIGRGVRHNGRERRLASNDAMRFSFSLTKMEKDVGLYQIRVSNSGKIKRGASR